MEQELKPCPFCGATPHQGLTKVEHCQLHGEPFQRFRIWCPHTCASITEFNRELAITAWNTRHQSTADLTAQRDALAEALERIDRGLADHLRPGVKGYITREGVRGIIRNVKDKNREAFAAARAAVKGEV